MQLVNGAPFFNITPLSLSSAFLLASILSFGPPVIAIVPLTSMYASP